MHSSLSRMQITMVCSCTVLWMDARYDDVSVHSPVWGMHVTMVSPCIVLFEGCTLWCYVRAQSSMRDVRAQSIVYNARYGTWYVRTQWRVKSAHYSSRSVHRPVCRVHVTIVDQCTGFRYPWKYPNASTVYIGRVGVLSTLQTKMWFLRKKVNLFWSKPLFIKRKSMFLRDILQQTIKCRAFDHESYVARGGGGGGEDPVEKGDASLFFDFGKYIEKHSSFFSPIFILMLH